MLAPVYKFSPYGFNVNFRAENTNVSGFNFQPKIRPQLTVDVFEKTRTAGINGSKTPAGITEKLVPYAEIKKLSPDARETARNKKIDKEKNHISSPVSKRTEYNTRQLRSAGVAERDINKYLTIDGHVNSEGKRILREKGKSYQ